MVRIELHLSKEETELLDTIAKQEGRSRKNLCENEIRKLIAAYQSKNKILSVTATKSKKVKKSPIK